MKKIVLKTVIILMGLLFMVSCECIKCDLDEDEYPEGLITKKKAADMQNDYLIMNENRYMDLDEVRSDDNIQFKDDNINIDNTDVVFTLDNLQDYFCYVGREFEELQDNKDNIIVYNDYSFEDLGVRIYYGAKLDKVYQDKMRTTVFLVPVIKLDPEEDDIEKIKSILIARRLDGELHNLEKYLEELNEYNQNNGSIEEKPIPDLIYVDILEIAPLNFGHSRRPPTLYQGYTGN